MGHVYLDGCWYAVYWDLGGKYWRIGQAEPVMLTRYCGKANQFGRIVAAILRGEEVVVPCKVGQFKFSVGPEVEKVP
jgi:hypothetical protein